MWPAHASRRAPALALLPTRARHPRPPAAPAGSRLPQRRRTGAPCWPTPPSTRWAHRCPAAQQRSQAEGTPAPCERGGGTGRHRWVGAGREGEGKGAAGGRGSTMLKVDTGASAWWPRYSASSCGQCQVPWNSVPRSEKQFHGIIHMILYCLLYATLPQQYI